MSVIGRLDKQVEEILINPLSKRDKEGPQERVAEKQPTEEAPQREPPPRATPSRGQEDLPVWML